VILFLKDSADSLSWPSGRRYWRQYEKRMNRVPSSFAPLLVKLLSKQQFIEYYSRFSTRVFLVHGNFLFYSLFPSLAWTHPSVRLNVSSRGIQIMIHFAINLYFFESPSFPEYLLTPQIWRRSLKQRYVSLRYTILLFAIIGKCRKSSF
jgi:hypothetical protein